MFDDIDKYCERLSSELWGEPLNIVSNLAYLIVCLYLLRVYRQKLNGNNWDIQSLIILLMFIAIGSSLWHIYAKKWSLYMDIVPILIFINLYILSCLYYVARCSFSVTAVLFLFYHVMNHTLQQIFDKEFLNGSIFYLPTWLFLIGIGLLLKQRNIAMSQQYLWVSIVFASALLFRTIDLEVCNIFPMGTHFIWHIISAYMMYLLVRLLILQRELISGQNKEIG